MSDNWVVQNLQNALDTWNKYLSEIWQLITQSPEQFKGGSIWSVIVNIHDAVRAIGLALLVLFFVIGIVKTCGSFAEVKKPEHALVTNKGRVLTYGQMYQKVWKEEPFGNENIAVGSHVRSMRQKLYSAYAKPPFAISCIRDVGYRFEVDS